MAERTFEGESADDKFQEALDAALEKLDAAMGEGGVSDASAEWRVTGTAGKRGSIVGFRGVKVTICATRVPAWR